MIQKIKMAKTRKHVDMLGREVIIPEKPKRIVSLVPSQTELLFDLGLDKEIVGITKYCRHPSDKVKEKPKVGGTKKFRFNNIDNLKPDLIIGNKEENYEEGIKRLKEKYPVWMSDVASLAEAYSMISNIGVIVGKSEEANNIIAHINEKFKVFKTPEKKSKALYFIWRSPYMVVGNDTFIHHMMSRCGFENAIKKPRYPQLKPEQIEVLDPEYIFLASEPYPFKEKNIQDIKDICPDAKVMLVDGELFSWYGSRLQYAPDYLKRLMEEAKKL